MNFSFTKNDKNYEILTFIFPKKKFINKIPSDIFIYSYVDNIIYCCIYKTFEQSITLPRSNDIRSSYFSTFPANG